MNYTISTNKNGNVVATTNFEKVGEYWYDGGGVACLADDMRMQEYVLHCFNGNFHIMHTEFNKNYQGFGKGMLPIERMSESLQTMISDMVNAHNGALTTKLAA